MFWLSALASLLLYALSQSPVRASPCLAFDADFNLYALGLGGKDWNAGTQDVWTTGQSFLFSIPHLRRTKVEFHITSDFHLTA